MTERLFSPEKERAMRTYRLVIALEIQAPDMIEAGMLVGKHMAEIVDDIEITEFEEVK
jgi:hypothetical protein